MTDDKLIRRLREGRRDALHQAIDRYTNYVSAVAFRAMQGQGTQEDLEEIVSDTFLSLWAHAGELREDGSLAPYLAAVARNKALDHLRKPVPPLPLTEEVPDRADTPEEHTLRREAAVLLWQAVNDMGEPDRTLFLRYYYDDEPLKAVAQGMGMNLSTAKTRLSRGRRKLREILSRGGTSHETASV